MDSDISNSEHDPQDSLDPIRKTLTDIERLTGDSDQTELYEFVRLLLQVVDLREESGADEETDRFLQDGLEELQSLIDSEQSGSDHLEWLRSEAIDRWGELLVSADDHGFSSDDAGAEAWSDFADDGGACEPESFDVDEPIAPSLEEISSLLGQLGQSAPPEVDASPSNPDHAEEQHDSDDVPVAPTADASSQSETPSHSEQGDAHEPLPTIRSDASTSISSLDPELREAFLDDAASCVSSMEDSLLKLDENSKDADALNQICRELHTLKGASASVGLSDLAEQLHELEDRLRDDHTAGRAPNVDALLKSVDSFRSQISPGDSTSGDPTPVVEDATLSSPTQIRPAPAPAIPDFSDAQSDDEMVRVKSSQLNRLMDMLAELVMLRNRRETELTDLTEVYHELIGSVSKMRLLSNEGNVVSDACTSLQLSEVANDVLEVAQHVRDCARPVSEGNTAVSQFIRQFRQELVALRRTPVSGLFRRLQRVVRDAANAESKKVRLELIGEDAGIERSLQQRLYEPLLHIVRNSVCHGIEMPDDRDRAGKERMGTITLEAKSGPDLFIIEIRDDGKGLDYDAIRRRGVEKGLLASDQVASREELAQLIFHPGFSTRQTTSQVAGRGVGMDVVATTIQRMRGWLEVDSEAQQGTRIRLSFPLPSVIQHAMVFRSGGQLFALPMQSVRSAGEGDHDGLRISFSNILGAPAAEKTQPIVLACDSPAGADGQQRKHSITLMVDEVIGPEEVVVRPLPTLLRHHPFCSGATLSGMGQTVLFLDARRLVETHVSGATTLRSNTARTDGVRGASRSRSARPHVLVVDDSLSARKRVVRSLRRYPVDIAEACDGKQALDMIKKQHFDAVFSDMEMPHVTGMELLAEVNSPDRKDPPPVVIISSRNEDEFTNRAKELGANNYLFKPLSDEELDNAINGIPALTHLDTKSTKPLEMSGETHDR